jgi:hypothetical protein
MSSVAYFPDAPAVVQSNDGKVYQFPTAAGAQEFEASVKDAGGLTVRLEPVPPPLPALARPLYDLEVHLAALIDTEDMIPPEQEQEYALELHATLVATQEKRDRVGQFRGHLQAIAAFSKAEVARLQARQRTYERGLEQLDAYITRVIEMLGRDAKDKRKKLEGKVCTIGLHGCDVRAEVTDEAAVPTKYKKITITLPAESWELLCDSLDLDLRDQILAEVTSPKVEVSTSLVKADLKAAIDVPGAKLAGGTYVEIK